MKKFQRFHKKTKNKYVYDNEKEAQVSINEKSSKKFHKKTKNKYVYDNEKEAQVSINEKSSKKFHKKTKNKYVYDNEKEAQVSVNEKNCLQSSDNICLKNNSLYPPQMFRGYTVFSLSVLQSFHLSVNISRFLLNNSVCSFSRILINSHHTLTI